MDLESHRDIVGRVKQVWNTWDIRVLMLVSVLIQALLTFLAPFRKRCANGFFLFCVWLLYLSADAVALFTIGLILSTNADATDPVLAAFWAPFLLIHLGGPDTISALALEDNELWLRHGLQLATQAIVTLYVFGLSVQGRNPLWLPTLLIFVDGCIKYIERTCALYFASFDTFKDSISRKRQKNPNSRKFRCKETGHGEESESEMISNAYTAYTMFKGLLINSALTFDERNKSREFFLSLDPKSAIRTIEIELNLIYDIFYTKATLLLNKKGFIFGRVVCFLSVVVAALLYCLTDKTKYNMTDVVITCVLLVGAIVLDLYAVLKLFVSDWFIIKVPSYLNDFSIKFRKFLSVWVKGYSRRWSQSISQFNILSWCTSNLALYYNNVIIKRIIHVLIGWFYVKVVQVDDGKLVEFLVEKIYEKARRASDASTSSATGIHPIFQTNLSLGPDEDLSLCFKDLDFNEILFTWNIATDICHRTSRYGAIKNKDCIGEELYCLLSKQLSDYLLYIYFILRQQPTISSVVGFTNIIFQETTNFGRQLLAWVLERNKRQEGNDQLETVLERFSNILMSDASKEESTLKITPAGKKVVFYNACKLAEKLRSLKENQWEITLKVWVELFCFAASRSQPRLHIARLNVGGELFTMTWLLMAHLGLAGRFQQDNQASLWEKLMMKKSMV